MPKDISFDGIDKNGAMCNTKPRNHGWGGNSQKQPEGCKPMTKTFFLQVHRMMSQYCFKIFVTYHFCSKCGLIL